MSDRPPENPELEAAFARGPATPAAMAPQDTSLSPALTTALSNVSKPPADGAPQITPSQGGAVAQSEKTPISKPPLDPRPYAWLNNNMPKWRAVIDQTADAVGVSPERLAWHAYKENGFKFENAPRGAAGEDGVMQILPSTGKMYSHNGRLDPRNPHDNIMMGALYIRDLDSRYGKDSVLSVARYNGSGEKALAYGKSAFPGAEFNDKELLANARGMSSSPQKLTAAARSGPDSFIRHIAQTAPKGATMSDGWRMAEGMLVEAFIRKGDIAGAQHARDLVLQMSHAGSIQHLMKAHQALSAGDGITAANELARSHAFFPDGTMGRFRSDGRGVYAERIDESDPSRRLGPSIPVTPEGIAGLLNITRDPKQYLKTLNEQQKLTSDMRLKEQHGQYYADTITQRDRAAAMQQDTTLTVAGQRDQSANARALLGSQDKELDRQAAMARTQVQVGAKAAPTSDLLGRTIDKEVTERYGLEDNTLSGEQRATASELYKGARRGGATPVTADSVARGLMDQSLGLVPLTDGNYGAVKKGDPQRRVIQLIPKEYGSRFAPPAQATPTPIGSAVMAQPANSGAVPARPPIDRSSAMPMGY